MARLTRNLLKAKGIEDEDIQDEIIMAHRETVDALKAERDKAQSELEKAKEDAEKLPGVQKELENLKEQIDKNKDNPYKGQYEELKTEYENYKKDVEKKAARARKAEAYKTLLKEAKVSDKRLDSILKISDIDSLELDENGDVKDREKKLAKIAEEWADFIVVDNKEGQKIPTPPTPKGPEEQKSRAAQVAAKFYANRYGTQEGGNK